MFESLSDRLQNALAGLKGRGKLTNEDIDAAMREIRLALLEADVNFKVVREFVAHVKERALGAEVMESLTPAQQVVKIVNEELTTLMGAGDSKLAFGGKPPTVILMAGLQGSGKTTTCAKLAKYLKKDGKRPVLIAADVYRPAAIDQLSHARASASACRSTRRAPTSTPSTSPATASPYARAKRRRGDHRHRRPAAHRRRAHGRARRASAATVKPHNILLVVDAMTGQDAVNAAEQFRQKVDIDGVVLTKLDGDARGGAALSVRAVTGKPIKFVSTGEKLDDFDYFHPDRMASRILGMGDVLSLIEKAERVARREAGGRDGGQACAAPSSPSRTSSTSSSRSARWARSASIIGMLPGVPGMKELKNVQVDDRQLDRIEAMIYSMTPQERRHPTSSTAPAGSASRAAAARRCRT